MNKKHFESIASIIRFNYLESDESEREKCMFIAKDLADYFKLCNANFDKSKFMEACFGK